MLGVIWTLEESFGGVGEALEPGPRLTVPNAGRRRPPYPSNSLLLRQFRSKFPSLNKPIINIKLNLIIK